MNNKQGRQLTPYETRIYFVPDMTAINKRKNQLNAIEAEINAINRQLHNQLNTMGAQINAINNQLNTLDAEKKNIRALKLKGLALLIIDFIRMGILAITYPTIKFHSFMLLDPHVCEMLYIILLLVEVFLIGGLKKSKKNYLLLAVWVYLTISFLFSLAKAPHTGNAIDYFCLFCAVLHLYPLYKGASLVYSTLNKEKISLKEAEQKKAEQKNLQQKREQRKKEQQKKIEQKRAEQKNLQQQKLQQIPAPTDQEFDAWLENRVREHLGRTIDKFGLKHEIANPRELLRVRGYVLRGMKGASHYSPQDLHYKLGTDGKRRYSINLYTYFYPADDRIIVFTYDINAMNWDDYRETTGEYFYQDVTAVTTEYVQDTVSIDDKDHTYRMQRFSLKLSDGTSISATVRSRPLENDVRLPDFDTPESDIDKIILQLRMLLRQKRANIL